MRILATAALALILAGPAADAAGPEKTALRILYVGNPSSPRGRAMLDLFRARFRQAEAAERKGFDPKRAAGFDVVVLDWSQQERQGPYSPLGSQAAWDRPTVLLGSAGLLLAEAWPIHGAIG